MTLMRSWLPCVVLLAVGLDKGVAQTTAFVDVTVVSMLDESLRPQQTVVIQGDRILAIGPADAVPVPPGAAVIDGSGRYLIPGLADMHVHIRIPFDDAPLFLDAGITTVLSLGTRSPDHAATMPERDRSREPGFMGPTFYTVGPMILGGESPDEAQRIVTDNVERGYDLVKVYREVSPETYARVHDTARRLGIKVTGHAQRALGMQPVYTHQQDLVHIEEYLYASFNPDTTGFQTAVYTSILVLSVLLLATVGWSFAGSSPRLSPVRKWFRIFTGVSCLFFIALFLSVTEPFAGVFAGNPLAVSAVGVLMLLVAVVAVVLTLRVRRAWRVETCATWKRAALVLVVGLAWTFVVCSACLTPRSRRTTDAGLKRIARDTAAAGIWVTPNLVMPEYVKRHASDEFYDLIQRPEMRYLTPRTRQRWINNNPFRVPSMMEPIQFAIWRNWTALLSRLTGELHKANVPLLAGSDAVGEPGPFAGSSLHEELTLLTRAGLTPYEALRTATVNAATYLGQETGTIETGLLADLVLLTGNPLDDIENVSTRIGVMKRGRWYTAEELETALARLARERQ
jgi:imidazolonepropionase-like amidohydrolase